MTSRNILFLMMLIVWTPIRPQSSADSIRFIGGELLGRPTDKSIAVNLCTDKEIEFYIEYGTENSVYPLQTSVYHALQNIPQTVTLSGLLPDTRYFYRVRWRFISGPVFTARPEYSFRTARAKGRPFSFAVEADPHMDTSTNPVLLKRTFTNILSSGPDFMIDLGDTFMSDKLPVINQQEVVKRNLLLRTVYDTVCHSVPLMMVQGNHDGELGWLLNGTSESLPVWAANIRKAYYPQPFPDGFYDGDSTNILFVGQRQNYYSWEWGNALFIVLDPYWFTVKKPGSSKNNWDWTLGRAQYEWFARVLKNSRADFKFVFAHQLIGGIDSEGRGGIEAVPFYEMGGRNSDSTYGFAQYRPGWELPLHQLMVKYQVSAFFHGHDHIFVKQDLDGIVYNELPQPGYFNFSNPEKSYANTGIAAAYGYTHGSILSSSGYLRVTVADTSAKVEYVRTYLPEHENALRKNNSTAHSYIIRSSLTAVEAPPRSSIPAAFEVHQNYPNPFNPSTTIVYDIPSSCRVIISVLDILGRHIVTLENAEKPAGTHSADFNASGLSSGIYLCRITAGASASTVKMILQK